MGTIADRFKHAWNAFMNKDPTEEYDSDLGVSYSTRPDRVHLTRGNERSIINSIMTRIAIDVAALNFVHAKVNDDERYEETVHDQLNSIMNVEANVDQTGRAFIQDIVMSMLDEGVVACAPIDTDDNPDDSGSTIIYTMRTGRITQWYPQMVKIDLYNDQKGVRKELLYSKSTVAIVENPLYSVMNEPNSTLRRLNRKLNLLDIVEEQTGSNRMDLIIQLPYTVKSKVQRDKVNRRMADIENQLANSKYGIAYIESTEHVTQLNRSVENNLLKSVEYWMGQVFNQLGITQSIFDGSADEATMLNYYNRTVEPIASAITLEFTRKFLSLTARTRGHRILFYKDPFKLVPVSQIAEIADKLTRNEIVSPNEIRQAIGMKPSKDPKADELRNRNIAQSAEEAAMEESGNVQRTMTVSELLEK